MFDLRYHVASLAAVFIALVIGILVGVAISSHTTLSDTERNLLQEQKAELRSSLDAETARAAQLAQSQRAAVAMAQAAYPLLTSGRLKGKRVGLVFVGPVDPRLRDFVTTALGDANAGAIVLRALKVPVDTTALYAALARRPALAKLADPTRADAIGRALGRELVAGGDAPLWNALSEQLVAERSGGGRQPLDGVVLVRTAQPQQGGSAVFMRGFYAGLASGAAPLVGVEQSSQLPSAVPVYRRDDISSVDDVELPVGRLALVALLAGAQPGNYGLAAGDTAVLPTIEPLPAGG
jgi:hypothetical protein